MLRPVLDKVKENLVATSVMGLLVVTIVVLATLLLIGPADDQATPEPLPTSGIMAPQDGDLTVGEGEGALVVSQLVGECGAGSDTEGGTSCVFDPAALLTLTSGPAMTRLRAGESNTFSISVTDRVDPTVVPLVEVAGDELDFTSAAPGEYSVTLVGDAGGVWQFLLLITD